MKLKNLLLPFITICIFLTCYFLFSSAKSPSFTSIEEYNAWLNNKDNNCIVSKKIAGVTLTAKYLPPTYIAFKDASNSHLFTSGYDTLLNQQKKQCTFLFTVAPDDEETSELRKKNSIMCEGVGGYGEYTERVVNTNFFMEQNLSLFIDDKEFKPAMCILENTYELSSSRTFMIVFTPNITDYKDGDFTLEYKDKFFNAGNVQFAFGSKNIQVAQNIRVNR